MLTRRTNILLVDEDYFLLKRLANQRKVSIGKLVREAVRAVYEKERRDLGLGEKIKFIRKLMKGVKITPSEIREFINEGRKF